MPVHRERTDATRVSRLPIFLPIERKLHSGEYIFTDPRTGKKSIVRSKNEQLSQDIRNSHQKKEDAKRAPIIRKKIEDAKVREEGEKTLGAVFKPVMPSTYIGPWLRNSTFGRIIEPTNANNESYMDNLMSGEGVGDEGANFVIDVATPFAWNGLKSIGTKAWNSGYTYVPGYGFKLGTAEVLPRTFVLGEPITSKSISFTPRLFESVLTGQDYARLIREGIEDAKSYLNGEVRASADVHNLALARRLGLDLYLPTTNLRVNTPILIKITNDGLSGYELGNYAQDLAGNEYGITIAPQLKPLPTAFHETLHRGDLQRYNVTVDPSIKLLQYNFNKFLLQHLGTNETGPYAEYLLNPVDGELGTNLMELAYRAGIKPGTPYPGPLAALEWFNALAKNKSKGFVMDYVRRDKPLRLWKALTGAYFKQGGRLIPKHLLGKKILAYLFNGKDGSFKEAFRSARNDGDSYFRWNGKLYNTNLKPKSVKPKNLGTVDFNRVVSNLWTMENDTNEGFRDGKYYPFKTKNGNLDVAFGIDLTLNPLYLKEALNGITKERANLIAIEIFKNELPYINEKLGRNADTVSARHKEGLLDMYWQLKNGLYLFNNLFDAIGRLDLDSIHNESKTYYWPEGADKNDETLKKFDSRRHLMRKQLYFH